jgi:hypothetical protein
MIKTITKLLIHTWLTALVLAASAVAIASPAKTPHPARLLMAHYMPWFQADPSAGKWGWHWTMNHYDSDKSVAGRRQIASHYYPLIGPYDSSDPDLLEYHVLLMKFAGFDGATIDWNGTDDYYDYAQTNRNSEKLAALLTKADLRFAIVYDDNCVRQLVAGHRLAPADVVAHGQQTLEWLQGHWFSSPNYAQFDDKPLFLVFGGNGGYYQGSQWDQIFAPLKTQPAYFSELGRNPPAIGGFGWPVPDGGTKASFAALDSFYGWYAHTTDFIAVAYPRFEDIYAEARVHKSWGSIDDQGGKTYEETLSRALKSKAPITQVATWNDWGEGTQIEPSAEFGYRDLEATQRLRKKYLDPKFPYSAQDLRLPAQLYKLRKSYANDRPAQAKLGKIAALLFAGHTREGRKALERFSSKSGPQ